MTQIKILIVEDESIIALDIKSILIRLGYIVTDIVVSGEECLKKIEKELPEMILMDIKLKGSMDGIETANIVKEKYDIPVVFITAHSDRSSLHRAKVTEPYGYIVKPVSERELYTTIETSVYRYRINKQLKENELKYRLLFEQSRDAIYLCDINGNVTMVNKALLNLFNLDEKKVIGKNVADFLKDPGEWKDLKEIIDNKGYVTDYEMHFKKNNGNVISAQITSTVMHSENKNIKGYQGIIRDISDRIKTMRELFQSREELRNLSGHLQNLIEEERTNISREIHDVLGQSLTALKMDLFWIVNNLKEDQTDIYEKASSMSDIVNSIIETIRRISSDLRPGILDDLGLFPAIEWQAEEFSKRSGINCKVLSNINGIDINEKISVAFFRIFQESLTNVARHSQATEVIVDLNKNDDVLFLKITDNGKGITNDEIVDSNSLGLIGIRERARACGGTVEFSGSSSGTRVTVAVPLHEGT